MKTFYQKDSKGNIKVWTIEVVDNFNHCVIITTDGIQGGTMTPNETVIDKGKGGRSILEQACSEMDSKIAKKIKSGYVDDINNVKSSSELGSGNKQPMLAQKYDPTGKQNGSKTLKQIGIEGKLVGCQDKCFSKDTILKVRNKEGGSVKEIRFEDLEKCWEEYEIYSYNLEKNNFEFVEIENFLNRKLNKKWLKVLLEDGTEVKCTEDHQWLTKRGWTEAKDLTEEDEIIFQ